MKNHPNDVSANYDIVQRGRAPGRARRQVAYHESELEVRPVCNEHAGQVVSFLIGPGWTVVGRAHQCGDTRDCRVRERVDGSQHRCPGCRTERSDVAGYQGGSGCYPGSSELTIPPGRSTGARLALGERASSPDSASSLCDLKANEKIRHRHKRAAPKPAKTALEESDISDISDIVYSSIRVMVAFAKSFDVGNTSPQAKILYSATHHRDLRPAQRTLVYLIPQSV